MAIFRKIHVQFWSDVFIQSLTPEQKFFFLYLLTNERTRQCGIYEISIRQISFDTGYNCETVEKLIKMFENVNKINFSRETNEIAIKNWDKYNSSRSPDVQTLVKKELTFVKNKKLIEWVQSVDTVLPHTKKSLREEPEEEPEQEPEVEEEKKPKPPQKEIGSEQVMKIAAEVWTDQFWRENMCIGLSMQEKELQKWLAMFNSSIISDSIPNFNKSNYKKMSRGWIMSQKAKGVKIDHNQQNKPSTGAPSLTILK